MQKIVIATRNQGKLKEFNYALENLPVDIRSMAEYAIASPAETGLTFVENALIKARTVAQQVNTPVIADDSGLVVPILNGQPGIYSARYAGENANDKANIAKLLKALDKVPKQQRNAYFYCVIVMLRHVQDPCPLIATGVWDGQILTKKIGDHGFGYDPIFYIKELECSAAQLTLAQKSSLSHRGKALKNLIDGLEEKIFI